MLCLNVPLLMFAYRLHTPFKGWSLIHKKSIMKWISNLHLQQLCCWLKAGLNILVAINLNIVLPVIIRFFTNLIASVLDSIRQSTVQFAKGTNFKTLWKTLLDCQVIFGVFQLHNNISFGLFLNKMFIKPNSYLCMVSYIKWCQPGSFFAW